ncbi:MAG TPA: hypothetical protein VIM99_03100, partial [Blastocatellia bacterium]
TLLPAVPLFDLDLRPLRFRIVEYLLWRRAPRPFDPWSSGLSLLAFGRRVVVSRFEQVRSGLTLIPLIDCIGYGA